MNALDENLDTLQIMQKLNQIYFTKWKEGKRPASGHGKVHYSKSIEFANFLRVGGMNLMKNKKYEEAVAEFTKSVALATEGSEELDLAYAARSRALFELGEYDCSLRDLTRVLEGKCSDDTMKIILRERKKECLQRRQISDRDERLLTLTEANRLKSRKTETYSSSDIDKEESESNYDNTFSASNTENKFLPNTSFKVKLEFDEYGKSRTVAIDDIEPGEILSIEEFFVTALDLDKRYTHCAHCLHKCRTLIPCTTCSRDLYCSARCREKAHILYHRVECQLSAHYERKETDCRATLALRAFLIGTIQGESLPKLMQQTKPRDIFERKLYPAGPLNSPFTNDYYAYLNLCRKFDEKSLMHYVDMALPSVVDAIFALQSLSFFPRNLLLPHNLSDVELFSALLLANNIVSVTLNCCNVMAQLSSIPFFYGETLVGHGVPVLHNFFTYSCSPNTCSVTERRQHVLHATRPIKRGEQITVSFRLLFARDSLVKRKLEFSNYGFTCHCEACVKGWPLLPELERREPQFIDESTRIAEGKKLVNLQHSLKKIRSWKYMNGCNLYELTCWTLQLLCDNLKMPSYEILICEMFLERFLNAFYSDFYNFDEKLRDDYKAIFTNIVNRVSQR